MDAQVVSFVRSGKNSFSLLPRNLDARKEKFYDKAK